jgi:hypothetical protein
MREWNVLTHCEKVKKGSGMKSLSLWFVMLYLYSIKISFICLYTWTWNILYTQIWNIVLCMSGRWNLCRVCKCDWCVALELCSYAFLLICFFAFRSVAVHIFSSLPSFSCCYVVVFLQGSVSGFSGVVLVAILVFFPLGLGALFRCYWLLWYILY